MKGSPSRKPARRSRVEPEALRGQILDAFSAKAKAIGIRGVMMGELASELRVSASTLYKHFPSKDALTLACIERWADELAAAEAAEPRAAGTAGHRDGFEQFMHWVDAWADANAALSPAFARDLQSDYPTAWRRYRDEIQRRKQRGAELLTPVLKSELEPRVALAVLDLILTTVLRPEFADRLRISRHEALRTAVTIWAGGAVDRRGKLRTVSSERGRKR
jgi:AcrR family transcriptional regulator